MSSSMGTPTFSLTSSQTASASPTMETGAGKIAWQTALYLIVVCVVVAIVATIIIFVGRVDWTIPTPWREKPEMEPRNPSPSSDSTIFRLPSAFMLIEMMIHFFSTTFLPAFQSLRTATTSSLGAPPTPQPILPLYAEPAFVQPVLTPPGPVVPRDNSFRVPSNPYTGSSH